MGENVCVKADKRKMSVSEKGGKWKEYLQLSEVEDEAEEKEEGGRR